MRHSEVKLFVKKQSCGLILMLNLHCSWLVLLVPCTKVLEISIPGILLGAAPGPTLSRITARELASVDFLANS